MNAQAKPQNASIAFDMSNEKYHSLPAISSTQLKTVLRSPAHFYAAHVAEGRKQKAPTDSMKLGSAVHALFLEPQADEIAIAPPCDKRTKAGREAWAAFEVSNLHKIILTEEQHDTAQAMVASLRAHPIHQIIMDGVGHREASIFYRDTESGLSCRVRPDYHIAPCDAWKNGLIIDLKTTDDAREGAFARTIATFGYHTSAAMYCDGFNALYGTTPDFIWLVIERDAPHACAAYMLTEDLAFIGHGRKREALELIAHCQRMNHWPSYSQEIKPITLPNWAI